VGRCRLRVGGQAGRVCHLGSSCTLGDSMAPSPSENEEDFNSAQFWRAPIAPLQQAPTATSTPPCIVPTEAKAFGSSVLAAAKDAAAKQTMINPPPRPGFEHLAAKPIPVEEMTTGTITTILHNFERAWRARNGRALTLADAKELPEQILALYDQIGKRLTPEERAAANRKLEQRHAEATAARSAEEAKHKAAEAARAKEWQSFEASKETAWSSAVVAAREQREEAAVSAGLDASGAVRSLSGAASWVKPDEHPKACGPTREAYLSAALDEFGLSQVDPNELTEEERRQEALEWGRRRGAAADEIAGREAWATKQGRV